MKRIISINVLVFVIAALFCQGSVCFAASDKNDKTSGARNQSDIDKILLKLNAQNTKLNTYQAKIDYFFQDYPEEMPESGITRTGNIYYKKDKEASKLLVRFDTFRRNDEKKEKRKEEYFFDGVWLKIIDHQNKTIKTIQKARKTKPVDAFELINRDFPMIGFSNKDDLRKHFDISIPDNDKKTPKNQVRLKMVVKKGSPYEKNYSSVDFRIDKKTFLPARIITTSTEGYIYDITLRYSKINKNLKDTVFKLETPVDFRETVEPIKK